MRNNNKKLKIVNGIVTTGCTEKEYKQIYRQPTIEKSVKKALELEKFDINFYNKLTNAWKSHKRTRKMIAFLYILPITAGLTKFTVDIAVTSIIKIVFLSNI